jgi:hypothetical protein
MNREVLGGRKHQSRKTNSSDAQTRKRKQKNQASNCDVETEEAQLQRRTRALYYEGPEISPKLEAGPQIWTEKITSTQKNEQHKGMHATQVFQLKSKQGLHPTHGGHRPFYLIFD